MKNTSRYLRVRIIVSVMCAVVVAWRAIVEKDIDVSNILLAIIVNVIWIDEVLRKRRGPASHSSIATNETGKKE